MTTQEKFDALVAEDGAEAVAAAVKGHVHPDGDGGCQPGYILVKGVCKLDVGN